MVGSVEIICIGNELLIGKIADTNAQWLAKRVTALGMRVRRITVVGDDVDEISTVTREVLSRKPRFILTTGGLGPTFDDRTLEGIAKALNRKLETNSEALRMIEDKYRRYVAEGRIEKFEMTSYRVKMARLPEGAEPLSNPVGTAPGVKIEQDESIIISLPGVPQEMKAIFEDSVAALIKEASGNMVFYEASIQVTGLPESEVAPIIDQVMHDNPYVYIKSHPKMAEKTSYLELHFSTTSDNMDMAKQRVGRAIIQISEIIRGKGGRIKPINP